MRGLLLILCIAATLTLAAVPRGAQAQTTDQPCKGERCDQGEAYSACMKYPVGRETKRRCDVFGPFSGGDGSYHLVYWYRNDSNEEIGPVNSVNNFLFQQSCKKRNTEFPPGNAAPWYNEPATCISGCKITGNVFSQANGGVKVYGMTDRTYTGEVCDSPKTGNDIGPDRNKEAEAKPKGDECTALGGGQTACAKPNGDHCATSSTGKTFCWKPSETGQKTDGPDAQTKGEKGKPVLPPTHTDPSKEYQRKEGHQQTVCMNNSCATYNVTNYGETSKGTAKNSTGDNAADGTGNTSGNGTPGKGSGSGSGGKEGEGDSASDSGNCEQAPACVGDTLKCLHLKFTWKIQCNTKGSEISKGNGCSDTDVPICAGSSCKAEAYAQVLQQWKQRCAVEAMGQGMAERAGKIGNPDDEGVVDGIWIKQGNGSGLKLRQDLISVGGGGSLLPDITLEGRKWEVPAQFWDVIAGIRLLIIAAATVMAMFIVGRNI